MRFHKNIMNSLNVIPLLYKIISRVIPNKRQFPKEKDSLIQKYYQRTHYLFWNNNEKAKNEELQFGIEDGFDEKKIPKFNAFKKYPP